MRNTEMVDNPPQFEHLSLFQVRLSKLALLLGDLLALVLAFCLATTIAIWLTPSTRGGWFAGQDMPRFASWGAIALLGIVLLLTRYQHYSDRRPLWDELGDFIRLVGLLALIDIAIVATLEWTASRTWWVLSWSLALPLLVLVRMLTRAILRQQKLWLRPTIIIGVGPNAADAAQALQSQPEMGLQVLCYVDAGGVEQLADPQTHPRLNSAKLPPIAKRPGVQWVIALEHAQSEQREYWLRQLAQWGVPDISVVPAMRGVPLHGTAMSHFFSHEVALLRMQNNLRRWPARLNKRIFDTLVAIVLLIMLSPLLCLLALIIRRDGGPAVFSHPRVGKEGRVFNCYKFRSMVVDAEQQLEKLFQLRPELMEQWRNQRKLKDDPRLSSIGDFLRRTSLDELPQLINVIKGDMSLVGPRPIVRSELSRYGADAGYYLMVRPGMTGLWQVSGRSDVEYDTRVYLDTWYVKNWSISYDLVIIFKTFSVVFMRNGAY
jgi:undecaprenyl-phosphate galactose phosphotransferase